MLRRTSILAALLCLVLFSCDAAQVPIASPDIEVNPEINVNVNVDGGAADDGSGAATDGETGDTGDDGANGGGGGGVADFSATFSGTQVQTIETLPSAAALDRVCCVGASCESPSNVAFDVTVEGDELTIYWRGSWGTLELSANDSFPWVGTTLAPPPSDDGCGDVFYDVLATLNRSSVPRTITLSGRQGDDCCVTTYSGTLTEVE